LLSLCTPMFPPLPHLPSFPTRRSSDLNHGPGEEARLSRVKAASGDSDPLIYNGTLGALMALLRNALCVVGGDTGPLHLAVALGRSEEHTSELQSRFDLVCRLLLEKKKT